MLFQNWTVLRNLACQSYYLLRMTFLKHYPTSTLSLQSDPIWLIILHYFKQDTPFPKSLTLLFNQSMRQCEVPESWKLSYVTPIFKKGARDCVSNYRPISLLSCLLKVLEKLIHKNILEHLTTNNLISPCQFGFIQSRQRCPNCWRC